MPIVLVRSNLASSYSHKYPWRVLVSGLLGNIIMIVIFQHYIIFVSNIYIHHRNYKVL